MNDRLFKSIGNIGDDLIEEAEESAVKQHFRNKKRKKATILKFMPLVACFAIIFCMIPVAFHTVNDNYSGDDLNGVETSEYPGNYDGLTLSKVIIHQKNPGEVDKVFTDKRILQKVELFIQSEHSMKKTGIPFRDIHDILADDFPTYDIPSGGSENCDPSTVFYVECTFLDGKTYSFCVSAKGYYWEEKLSEWMILANSPIVSYLANLISSSEE